MVYLLNCFWIDQGKIVIYFPVLSWFCYRSMDIFCFVHMNIYDPHPLIIYTVLHIFHWPLSSPYIFRFAAIFMLMLNCILIYSSKWLLKVLFFNLNRWSQTFYLHLKINKEQLLSIISCPKYISANWESHDFMIRSCPINDPS